VDVVEVGVIELDVVDVEEVGVVVVQIIKKIIKDGK